MTTQNAINSKFTNNADGFDIGGGTTSRKITLSGGDVSIVGTGSAIITFPSSTSTLATLALSEALTNKSVNGVTLVSGGSASLFLNQAGNYVSGGTGTVTSVASADGSITVTNGTTTPDLAVVKAPIWTTARLLAGNSVNGSANVAFANKFIVQGTTDTGLSGAQFLGALTTGLVKNTTTTGVLSIATAGTDYLVPTTALTTGSVLFAGASGDINQSNAAFFWDNTNKRLGINSAATPTNALDARTSDSGTTTVTTTASFGHNTSGTAAANFGTAIQLKADSATVANRELALIQAYWVTATDATRSSRVEFYGTAANGTQTKFMQWGRGGTLNPEMLSPQTATTVLSANTNFSVINTDATTNNVSMFTLFSENTAKAAGIAATQNNLSLFTGNTSRIAATFLNAGQAGIGTVTAPTAILHLQAGTTAASTAPLKFNSGSLMTTAEAGAVEFLTDTFYGTITTGAARRTFAMLEATQTWTATQTFPSPVISTALIASANTVNIGSTTTGFAKLYITSTGVLDFGNANMTVTHASGVLTIAGGDLKISSPGTTSTSVITLAGTQTLTNKSIVASQITTGTFGTGAYTMDTSLTVPQIFNTTNSQTASANAITFTRANRQNKVTNNSAAGLTITLSTTSAVDGDMLLITSLPSSAVAQTITWVNTEVSDITPSANLNASTTSPRTDGFRYNGATSKWRCIGSA